MKRAALFVLAACGASPPPCARLPGANVSTRFENRMSATFEPVSSVFAFHPERGTVSVTTTYRGHGYGVFSYLSKYTFTARGETPFTVEPGRVTEIVAIGYERERPAGPLEDRPAIAWRVSNVDRCAQ